MNLPEILAAFTRASGGHPIAALEAARAQRPIVVPGLLHAVRRFIALPEDGRFAPSPLFYAFHLLGEFRVPAACPLFSDLFRLDPEALDHQLGDALTETAHRVMANVFDGEIANVTDVIECETADFRLRSGMFATLVMLVRSGALARETVSAYLGEVHDRLGAEGVDDTVWCGWAEAVLLAGWPEHEPLVRRIFEEELIGPELMDLEDFERSVATLREGPEPDLLWSNLGPFGAVEDGLAGWGYHTDDPDGDDDPDWRDPMEPAVNPYRHVGRNDPCPCGSGLKFKRCCGKS